MIEREKLPAEGLFENLELAALVFLNQLLQEYCHEHVLLDFRVMLQYLHHLFPGLGALHNLLSTLITNAQWSDIQDFYLGPDQINLL